MADWSRGYPVEESYLDTLQPELSPFRWRAALLTARRRPVAEDRPFRFVELGCGSALSLLGLAACYPHGRFSGYDFLPEHVVRARAMIAETGLGNIIVEEASFADLAASDPPARHDYAALHGVWTWVDAETRADIVTLLGRWLSPGALAYLGYNAAAGWAAAAPLRRIFREIPADARQTGFTAARAAAEDWLALGDAPAARALWARIARQPDGYLLHEFASVNGSAAWPQEVLEDLARAKMGFACAVELGEQFDAMFLPPERMDFLRRATEAGLGETARDLAHARTFRADLFHRGAPRLTPREMVAGLRALHVIGWGRDRPVAVPDARPVAEAADVHPDLRAQIAARIGDGPATLGAVIDSLDMEPRQALQTMLVLMVYGDILAVRSPDEAAAAQAGCDRFNAFVARRLAAGSLVPGLASPVLGSVIHVPRDLRRAALGLDPAEPGTARMFHALGIVPPDLS
ncbi:class I SAM-dependent methyltransferase [Roseivivax isoporae]|uniref:Uncharacterized protein n=1 Tax=Roseivivax isoporae LMG 25204 TaxID=1449351 RepID=X7F3V8_9RHOB|nr:class I SAM-dependent methyltransferase [Roseivivax isoporae]ETX26749.1 hypothetical protein RISW2_19380 [Roseivivax isoporae LMG 25204]